MSDVCRICLSVVYETNSVSVFFKMSDNKSVLEIIKECSSVQVLDEDDLPKRICTNCRKKLKSFYGFRNLIINSDLQLKKKLKTEAECVESPVSQTAMEDKQNIEIDYYPANQEEFEIVESKPDILITDQNDSENFLNKLNSNFKDLIADWKKNMMESDVSENQKAPKQTRKLIKVKKKQYKCKECNETFKSSYNLRGHMIGHTGIIPYSCEICNKGFCRKWSLTMHSKVHSADRPFPCDVCQKRFRSPGNLILHKATHSEVKKYNCDICTKGFAQLSSLEVHVRRHHTGEKPYMCEVCSNTFADHSCLARHKRTHQGIKLVCPECGNSYRDKEGLKRHMKRHNGLKPFSCDKCDKKFTEAASLRRHELLHSKIKPYECKFCEKSFSQSSILVRHLRIHSGEKPFACTLCPKDFAYKHHLQGHMKSHHKDASTTSVNGDKTDEAQIETEGNNLAASPQ